MSTAKTNIKNITDDDRSAIVEAAFNLREQNDLADALIVKLERIKSLWDDLPCEEVLEDLSKQAGNLADCLEAAKTTFLSDDFPCEDDLECLAKQAAQLVDALGAATEGVPE